MPVIEGRDVRVRSIDAGTLRLDGGAMFGVVPKPLWSRQTEPDERNRIPLAMRCLLIETSEATVLVDTGLGSKESTKFLDIYGVENAGSPSRLEDSLRGAGVDPEQIDVVINTHLHFDHAGGNTFRSSDGSLQPSFPNARYVIRRGEWEFSRLSNERVRASYMPPNFAPLDELGRVQWVDADTEVVPGIRVERAAGHTPYHQVVRVNLGDDTLLYLADLVPTVAHMPLPWIMGYDVEPLVTLESKRLWLERAAEHGWLLAFEHDPVVAWGRAQRPDGGCGCMIVDETRDEFARSPISGGL